ncbi:glycosyltransferase [Vibrio splendidus]
MKVLHLTLGLGNGGAEGALYRLIKFDKSNEHIVISIMGDGYYGKRLRDIGVDIYSYDVRRGCIPLSIPFKIYRDIRSVKPDVLQTWLYHADILGGVVGRLAGVRNVFWGIRHSNLSPDLNSRTTLVMSKVSALLSRLVPKRIISCSRKATDVHIATGYEESKFVTIPNGYDFESLTYSYDKRRDYRGKLLLNDNFVFGMVARWNPQKNHKNLIEAVAYYIDNYNTKIKVVLVGPDIDSENKELLSLINKYNVGSNIILLGPTNDIPGVMSMLDVLVLPSSGEAFPNVVAEAMACSTPVVTTNVGDAAFIVGDTGWIVPPNDSKSLAEAMHSSYMASGDNFYWNLTKESCRDRIVNNFSIESMVNNFNDAWESKERS